MKTIRVAITPTESTIHPMHAFLCESPAVDREYLLDGHVDEGIETIASYIEGDPAAYETALTERLDPETYEIYPTGDGFFCYLRAPLSESNSEIMVAFQQETLAIVPPIEFHSDRRMLLSLVASTEDIQTIIETLPDGMGVDVLSVGSVPQIVGSTLTDRQREAVEAAVACGYYAVPREGSLQEVADSLGCAESTASVLLRRGHRRLVTKACDTSGRFGG